MVAFLFLLLATGQEAKSQWYKEETPLHQFFQKHFDSTLIYHEFSSWSPYPNYHIVAKSKGSVFLFTYKNPYAAIRGRNLPMELALHFYRSDDNFQAVKPDTNRYLLPFVPAFHYNGPNRWEQLAQLRIWQLQPATQFTATCSVEDGSEIVFYRITKNDIQTIYFYDAEELDTCTPADTNRKTAIELMRYFRDLFKVR